MLLIVIVALITTGAFYRRAKLVGVHPGKAASVPFMAAGIALALAYLASLAIARIAVATHASAFTLNAVNIMLNVFVLLAYLTLIQRNWLALAKPPDGGLKDETR